MGDGRKVVAQGIVCGRLTGATFHVTEVLPNHCGLRCTVDDWFSVLRYNCSGKDKQAEDVVLPLLVPLQRAHVKAYSADVENY